MSVAVMVEKHRTCAVCGEEKTAPEFGDGIKVPLTTCLACSARCLDRKEKEKKQ